MPGAGRLDGGAPPAPVLRYGLAIGACAILAWFAASAPRARIDERKLDVVPIARELAARGENIDDACFWVDPVNAGHGIVFVTGKLSGTVEVFDVATGERRGEITGFGRPNNCAVEGDLLLTTDRDRHEVEVHHVPDLTPLEPFGQDMAQPEGIDVLTTPEGRHLVYVTDSGDGAVHVYDLDTREPVRTFPTTFGTGIEPIVIDDRLQRVFISRGEKESTKSIGLFTPEGELVREFGDGLFGRDVEGLALYACGDGGYLIAADQSKEASEFEVFDRDTLAHLGTFRAEDGDGDFTDSTDGIDVLQAPMPGFASGVLVACDGCGSSLPEEMDVIDWERIANALGLDRCPSGGPPQCSPDGCTRRVAVSADAFVARSEPDANFGAAKTLEIERHPPELAEIVLRFEVGDLPGLEIVEARVRLTADRGRGAASVSGGRLFRATGDWRENDVSFARRPQSEGGVLAVAGGVKASEPVDFDVSAAVTRPGTHDFVLAPSSRDRVRYLSREAGESPPTLVLTLRPRPDGEHAARSQQARMENPPE